jgi:hypothetical protein
MSRAIYVGEDTGFLRYGMTGSNYPDYFGPVFYPDGIPAPFCVERKDLYIPAEDQTKYYPKP